MKYIIVSFLLTLLFCSCDESPKETNKAEQQSTNNLHSVNKNIGVLIDKLKNADSVVLVSHIDNNIIRIKDENRRERIESVPLCDSLELNENIIKEKKKLTKELIDTLCYIFSKTSIDEPASAKACFEPHHTIFIFKNSKLSFVNICFSCHQYETSPDLKKFFYLIENDRWLGLKNFYYSLGFRYELNFRESHPNP